MVARQLIEVRVDVEVSMGVVVSMGKAREARTLVDLTRVGIGLLEEEAVAWVGAGGHQAHSSIRRGRITSPVQRPSLARPRVGGAPGRTTSMTMRFRAIHMTALITAPPPTPARKAFRFS